MLASGLRVTRGTHTLSWDGLAENGAKAIDGRYALVLQAKDALGKQDSAKAPLLVDTSGPLAIFLSRSPIPANRGIVISVRDVGSGVAGATLYVDGRRVASLPVTRTRLIYVPRGRWPQGAHSFTVIARDRAGNVSRKNGRFTVRGTRGLGQSAFLVCNIGGSTAVLRVAPTACTVLPPEASFAEGVNLVGLRWSGWGSTIATAVGYEQGFHLPLEHIPVRIQAYRLRRNACPGPRVMLYTRVRATSTYGSTVARAQACFSV
jgi:hypothetical protein